MFDDEIISDLLPYSIVRFGMNLMDAITPDSELARYELIAFAAGCIGLWSILQPNSGTYPVKASKT